MEGGLSKCGPRAQKSIARGGRELVEVAEEAGAELVCERSLKAA
jgi:hypothetical protein